MACPAYTLLNSSDTEGHTQQVLVTEKNGKNGNKKRRDRKSHWEVGAAQPGPSSSISSFSQLVLSPKDLV